MAFSDLLGERDSPAPAIDTGLPPGGVFLAGRHLRR